jgi:hypothetical protein
MRCTASHASFDGDMARLLRYIAKRRTGGASVLLPTERLEYAAALGSGDAVQRMALAARVVGDVSAVAFWRSLLLANWRLGRSDASATAAAAAASGSDGSPPDSPGAARLDGEALRQARERACWRERCRLPGGRMEAVALESRVLELAAIGDAHAAVAHLLSQTPDGPDPGSWYRAMVGALALSACAGGGGGPSAGVPVSPLHRRVLRVVGAQAANAGDLLLTVPLYAAARLYAEAAAALQDGGLWFLAAAMAPSLGEADRAQALKRWSGHLSSTGSDVWRALNVLVAAGDAPLFATAVEVLSARQAWEAAAVAVACEAAGRVLKSPDVAGVAEAAPVDGVPAVESLTHLTAAAADAAVALKDSLIGRFLASM